MNKKESSYWIEFAPGYFTSRPKKEDYENIWDNPSVGEILYNITTVLGQQ